MASLQIPFSKWDWNINLASLSPSSSPKIQSKNSSNPADNVDFQWTHRSNPIESSFSNSSPILLEGQTVLVHQTSREIWLFVGLANGSIWKWSFNIVHDTFIFLFFYLFKILIVLHPPFSETMKTF